MTQAEYERAILSGIMQRPDVLLKATDIITTTDFYGDKHRAMWAAMLEVYASGATLDVVTVADVLSRSGHEPNLGAIVDLYNSAVSAANVEMYCYRLRDLSACRQMATLGQQMAQDADQQADPAAWVADIESRIVEISRHLSERVSPECSQIVRRLCDYWDRIEAGDAPFIPTMPDLADHVPGYVPGHLWVVGGYTSAGKSTLMAQMAVNAMQAGARTLIFSTEDSRQDKIIRMVSYITDIHQSILLQGQTTHRDARVIAALDDLQEHAPVVYDNVFDVDSIRLKIKKHALRGCDIVFIDFLQNLMGDGSLYERMSDAAIKLQAMAKEMGVCIVAMSQVSNEGAQNGGPVISLKGAGELAAAADIVLMLNRTGGERVPRDLDLVVRKNRPFGRTGKIHMQFSDRWTRIVRRAQ